MAWNVRPCGDPSNFMLMPANGASSGDALFAMLESYPFSSLRGLQDAKPSGMFGKRPFFTMFEQHEEDIDERLMECGSSQLHHGEKKRRLTVEQVRSLERSFEVENKLEPERKIQLAQELGLQPRQVAVWFQNRRARWKTKQIERDYDDLKENFDAVVAENQELQAELARLKAKLEACKSHGQDIVVVKTEEQETSQQQPEIEPSHSQTLHSASMTEEICKKSAAKDFSTCSDVSTGDAGSSPEEASPGDGVHERDNASIDSSHFTESYPEVNEQQQFLAQFGHVMKYVEGDGSYEPFISDLVFNVEDPSTTYNSLWD